MAVWVDALSSSINIHAAKKAKNNLLTTFIYKAKYVNGNTDATIGRIIKNITTIKITTKLKKLFFFNELNH